MKRDSGPDLDQTGESEFEVGLNQATEDAKGLVVTVDVLGVITPRTAQPVHSRGDLNVVGDLEAVPKLHGIATISHETILDVVTN